jgi:hypothetical protein
MRKRLSVEGITIPSDKVSILPSNAASKAGESVKKPADGCMTL